MTAENRTNGSGGTDLGLGAIAPAPALVLPSGRFEGRHAFAQLVRDALACAARDGWNQIILADANFEDWPLNERSVVESLQSWSKTGRHITLLAHSFEVAMRKQPRLVSWRKTWSHIIECRQCRQVDPLDFPSAIWSRSWAMQRINLALCQGVSGGEPDRRIHLRELLDEKIRISSPGFPSSVLGL